jgi:S-formylglutathione hydrolase FrmB
VIELSNATVRSRGIAALFVLGLGACVVSGSAFRRASNAVPRSIESAGVVDSFVLKSAALHETLAVRVYLPREYSPARRYPAVYALQHGVFFDRLGLPAWMDSASTGTTPPALVVAIPDASGLDAFRPDTPRGDAYVRFIAGELVPAVEARYSAQRGPGGRLLLGFSAGANVLIDVAARNPGTFGRVAAASPGWMFRDDRGGIGVDFHEAAVRNVAGASAAPVSSFWFVWGDSPSEWEHRSRINGSAVLAALRARGAAVIDAGVTPGDHGLDLARTTMAPALAFLLGVSRSAP